jgi:hypothetical protein
METLFFFATYLEAEKTIQILNACETSENDGSSFFFPGGRIIITGIGCDAARSAALKASSCNCRWINLGIAGCLEKKVPIGTSVRIGRAGLLRLKPGGLPSSQIYCSSSDETVVLDPCIPASLFTSPAPLYCSPTVSGNPALVDMEGYSLAYVARERGVYLSMVKIVSDFCSEDSHTSIISNLKFLSSRLAEEARRFCIPIETTISTQPQA